jgi:hypothetical protein
MPLPPPDLWYLPSCFLLFSLARLRSAVQVIGLYSSDQICPQNGPERRRRRDRYVLPRATSCQVHQCGSLDGSERTSSDSARAACPRWRERCTDAFITALSRPVPGPQTGKLHDANELPEVVSRSSTTPRPGFDIRGRRGVQATLRRRCPRLVPGSGNLTVMAHCHRRWARPDPLSITERSVPVLTPVTVSEMSTRERAWPRDL